MLHWMLPKNVASTLPHRAARPQRGSTRGPRTVGRLQQQTGPLGLDAAATGMPCRIVSVTAPPGQGDWGRWLAEIGFIAGEAVSVQARSAWGGDPMVVRIAESTFALRRAEAACVQVQPVVDAA